MPSPRVLLTALVLLPAATLVAGMQGRDYVGSLTDNSQQWCFAEHDGEPVLASRKGFKRSRSWTINAPTMLCADQSLTAVEGGRVVFGKPKEAGTQWTFEIVEQISPRRESPHGKLVEGEKGYVFRAQVADGPFRGWYLAAEQPADKDTAAPANAAVHRSLKLVRDRKSALEIRWIEASYRAIHK